VLNRSRIVGVAAGAFLLGAALPAAFVAGAGLTTSTAAQPEVTLPTATVTATATSTVTATAKVTVTASPELAPTPRSATAPFARTPSAMQPRGALLVQAGPAGGFGQSFAEGRCAVWRTGFVNQSVTPIVEITMAPPSGEYTGEWNGHTYPTRSAAKPAPAVLNVYIGPGKSAAVEYKTCTSTPSPGSKFEYGAEAPEFLTYRWETGQVGRACFRC
jgi:hypothetical protein